MHVFCQLSRFIVRSHVQQHMIGLANGFYKPVGNRTFPRNGLQVKHLVDALPLENEVSCANTLWVGQKEHPVTVLHRLVCGIQQRFIVL